MVLVHSNLSNITGHMTAKKFLNKKVFTLCIPNNFMREFRPDTDGADTYNGQNLVVPIDILIFN